MHCRLNVLLKFVVFALFIHTVVALKDCFTQSGNDVSFPRSCQSAKVALRTETESLVGDLDSDFGYIHTDAKFNFGGCEVKPILLVSNDIKELIFGGKGEREVVFLPATVTVRKDTIEFASKDTGRKVVACSPKFTDMDSDKAPEISVEFALGSKAPGFYATFKAVDIYKEKSPVVGSTPSIFAICAVAFVLGLFAIGSVIGLSLYRWVKSKDEEQTEGIETKSKRMSRVRVINAEHPKPLKPNVYTRPSEEHAE